MATRGGDWVLPLLPPSQHRSRCSCSAPRRSAHPCRPPIRAHLRASGRATRAEAPRTPIAVPRVPASSRAIGGGRGSSAMGAQADVTCDARAVSSQRWCDAPCLKPACRPELARPRHKPPRQPLAARAAGAPASIGAAVRVATALMGLRRWSDVDTRGGDAAVSQREPPRRRAISGRGLGHLAEGRCPAAAAAAPRRGRTRVTAPPARSPCPRSPSPATACLGAACVGRLKSSPLSLALATCAAA